MNEGLYVLVDPTRTAVVSSDPQRLPKSWDDPVTGITYGNLRDETKWNDDKLISIRWYPANIITPAYDTTLQYLGNWTFDINAVKVDCEREVIDKTEAQIDKEKPLSFTEIQRSALEISVQVETTLAQNQNRLDLGQSEIIPAADISDVQSYLASLYNSVDTGAPQVEPPAAIRQSIQVPTEFRDRLIAKRQYYQWNVPDDIFGMQFKLYTPQDATGFSVYIRDGSTGQYLYTMALVHQGDDLWQADTLPGQYGQLLTLKAFKYSLFKGVEISQIRDLPADMTYEHVSEVGWL